MDPYLLHPMTAPTPFIHPYTKVVFEYVFGEYPFGGALITLQVLDILTGFAAAFIAGRASSSASWKGMVRKCVVWAIVIAFGIASKDYPQIPAAKIAASFFSVAELISLIENAGLCGVRLPPGIIKGLKVLRDMQMNLDKVSMGKDNGPTVVVNMPEPKVVPIPVPTEQPLVIREIYGENRTHADGPESFEIVDNTQDNKEPAKEP